MRPVIVGISAKSGNTIPPRVVCRASSLRIRILFPRGSTNSLNFRDSTHSFEPCFTPSDHLSIEGPRGGGNGLPALILFRVSLTQPCYGADLPAPQEAVSIRHSVPDKAGPVRVKCGSETRSESRNT